MVAFPLIGSVVCSSLVLIGLSYYMRKKGIGMDKQLDEGAGELPEGFKVNYLYAAIPLLPLIILMLGNTGALPMLKMPVSHAMIICAGLAKVNPITVTRWIALPMLVTLAFVTICLYVI